MKATNNRLDKLDYYINVLSKGDLKTNFDRFMFNIPMFSSLALAFIITFYCLNVLSANICQIIIIGLIMSALFIPILDMVILLLKRLIFYRKLNKLSHNKDSREKWQQNFINCEYPKLIDLIIAERYNLVNIEDYKIKKDLFISQHTNYTVRNKFINEFDMDGKRLKFLNTNQQDVNVNTLCAVAKIANDLHISDHELNILRNNFINNDVLISKDQLTEIRILAIISDEEHDRKLTKIQTQYRRYLLNLPKLFIKSYCLISALGYFIYLLSLIKHR